jgi:acylglycerol lipase
MRIRKSTLTLALSGILALGQLAFLPAANAGNGSKSFAPAEESEATFKRIKTPTDAPLNAPMASWLPPAGVKPRIAMLCIHGFSMHKGCYAAFGKEMAKNGIATYAIDMRGFGERKEIGGKVELDFDGSLVDIKASLEQIQKAHPGLPVIVLGESMGGAIALRTAALYPELVAGLISSVPAKDRFSLGDEGNKVMKAGFQTMLGGFNKQMTDAAASVVNKISEKEDLRNTWKTDPLMRTSFSPKEFMQLDTFMSRNLDAAEMVTNTPVLFIQGSNDKLIRPAGTWKLFEKLSTSNRQMVLSKNSEHLIFEEGQFNPEDIKFVLTWMDRNIGSLDPAITGIKDKLPVVASKEEYSGSVASAASGANKDTDAPTAAPAPAALPSITSGEFKNRIATNTRPKISYWIELNRDGKIFRCNNQMEFKSGDAIRFHLIPESAGYAYLVMKASTTGKSDLLFPNQIYGTENYLKPGKDYSIPAEGWMQFDGNPGTESLGLMFGQEKFSITPEMIRSGNLSCFKAISKGPKEDGKKEVCSTRMKLSWDDPNPVMIPDDFSPVSQITSSSAGSSLVRLTSNSGEMVSASIQLFHGK